MRTYAANEITAANAGRPHQPPVRTRWTARIAPSLRAASARMKGQSTKYFALGIVAAIIVVLSLAVLLREPEYDGKPVSGWFHDLCVSGGLFLDLPHGKPASVFRTACVEFSKMNSNAVPYLVKQLRYDRSGRMEKLMFSLNHCRFTTGLTQGFVYPSERRNYAALTLGLIGTNAALAVPNLMEAWAKDDSREVKLSSVKALKLVLQNRVSCEQSATDPTQFERRVIAEAARLYPREAAQLGLDQPRQQ